MPTPAVNDMGAGKTIEQWDDWTERMKQKHANGNGHGASLNIEMLRLLRTPSAIEGEGGANSAAMKKAKGRMVMVRDQMADLAFVNGLKVADVIANDATIYDAISDYLPTTGVSMANGATAKEVAAGNPKKRIETEVLLGKTNWGKFSQAIARWESVIGRAAPEPTKPDGKDGAHRLSSRFTEWMMGLSDGWITDVGLKRSDELKACGNGVVPQQAEFALRILLKRIDDKE